MPLELFLVLQLLLESFEALGKFLVETFFLLVAFLFAGLALLGQVGLDFQDQGKLVEVVLLPYRDLVAEAIESGDLEGGAIGLLLALLLADEDIFNLGIGEGGPHARHLAVVEHFLGSGVGQHKVSRLIGPLQLPVVLLGPRGDFDRLELVHPEEFLVEPVRGLRLHIGEGLADKVDRVGVPPLHVATGIGLGHAAAKRIGASLGALIDLAEPKRGEVLSVLVLEGQEGGRFVCGGVRGLRVEKTEPAILRATDGDGLDNRQVPDLAQQAHHGLSTGGIALALRHLPAFRSLREGDAPVLFLDDNLGDLIDREVGEDLLLLSGGSDFRHGTSRPGEVHDGRDGTDDHQGDQKFDQCFRSHDSYNVRMNLLGGLRDQRAAIWRRRNTARPMPKRMTRMGTTRVLPNL